jgi:cytochrome c peroxidase
VSLGTLPTPLWAAWPGRTYTSSPPIVHVWVFTDNKFHNIGVGADTRGNFADAGRYALTKNAADMGAFKTPTLRNIAVTAPYMHDGSQATLKDVVDHYVGGGTSNPHLDKEIHTLDFRTFNERADLKAFLESLTGSLPPNGGPTGGLAVTKEANCAEAVVQ